MNYYEFVGFAVDTTHTDITPPDRPTIRTALFLLDFDGTLVDIADRPDAVQIPSNLSSLLTELHERTGGAMAIVSGRKLDDIEHFLPDYPGSIYASHGAEWRKDGERGHNPDCDGPELDRVRKILKAYCEETDLLFEDKPVSVVVHYRKAPDKWAQAHAFANALIAECPHLMIRQAKMAFEVCHVDASKRTAVEDMLKRFPGRHPLAFGDDATDEEMFDAVLAAGGETIKVGEGTTSATHRLGTPAELRELLAKWLARQRQMACPAD